MMRIASPSDSDLIFDMALKFVNQTEYVGLYSEKGLRSLINRLLSSAMSDAVVFVEDEVGMIGGITSPFLFNPDLFVATEIAWWIEPEHRKSGKGKELLGAFEYWAAANGCAAVTMVALGDSVAKVYEKAGYKLRENVYMKELN